MEKGATFSCHSISFLTFQCKVKNLLSSSQVEREAALAQAVVHLDGIRRRRQRVLQPPVRLRNRQLQNSGAATFETRTTGTTGGSRLDSARDGRHFGRAREDGGRDLQVLGDRR